VKKNLEKHKVHSHNKVR